jgi:hypothetical protein
MPTAKHALPLSFFFHHEKTRVKKNKNPFFKKEKRKNEICKMMVRRTILIAGEL